MQVLITKAREDIKINNKNINFFLKSYFSSKVLTFENLYNLGIELENENNNKLFLITDGAIGGDCSASGDADCDTGEVCDTGNSDSCICNANNNYVEDPNDNTACLKSLYGLLHC